ncbi:MAG: hydroxymyristoyl-ACP dehydratase [Treponema sp.]|nr:hydroxymyristoyl-ACP dehydratase [Treponema sp.]
MDNLHNIQNEKFISKTEDEIELQFLIPSTSDFFDGHFPEFKLLPAVAQFEVVTRFAKKYFGTMRFVPEIKRIKFSAPIKPDTTVNLKLSFNRQKHSMQYTLWDAAKTEKVYSSGAFSVQMENASV